MFLFMLMLLSLSLSLLLLLLFWFCRCVLYFNDMFSTQMCLFVVFVYACLCV